MKYYNNEHKKDHARGESRVRKNADQFYPFDLSEISSTEADEVEAYYANRHKWS